MLSSFFLKIDSRNYTPFMRSLAYLQLYAVGIVLFNIIALALTVAAVIAATIVATWYSLEFVGAL